MINRRQAIMYTTGLILVPSAIISCGLDEKTIIDPPPLSKLKSWEERAKQLEDYGLVKSRENGSANGATEEDIKIHVPKVTFGSNSLGISVNHSMTPDHYITTIYIKDQDDKIFGLKELLPITDKIPYAEFGVPKGTTSISAFSFCNVHNHWCEKVPMQHQ